MVERCPPSRSDYIHQRGLKFGLCTHPPHIFDADAPTLPLPPAPTDGAAASTTCAGSAGSLYHEREDAETLAGWGVDYFKYDNCGMINIQSYAKCKRAPTPLGHLCVPTSLT